MLEELAAALGDRCCCCCRGLLAAAAAAAGGDDDDDDADEDVRVGELTDTSAPPPYNIDDHRDCNSKRPTSSG